MDLPEPVNITTLPETPLESGHINHKDLPWVDQGFGIEMKAATSAREHAALSTGKRTLAPVPEHVGGGRQGLARLCCQGVRGIREVRSS